MLHPRYDFLPNVTALVEIDTMQAIHVGLVRKRVAIHEVQSAARNACSDAVRIISRTIDHFSADQVGGLLRESCGNKNAPAECGVARIGKRQIGFYGWLAVPHRKHAQTVGQILHRHLGTQPIETELVGKVLRQRTRTVDQESAALAGSSFRDQEIGRYLALRCQQRAEPAEARS